MMAQGFPWWAFDSVIEEVQARGYAESGLGMFEPWSVCNAEGELIGFGIDVAARVAEDVGVEVEFARTNWSYIIPSLIAEDFDVIISGMVILPERNLKVNFTSPYNSTGIYLVANTGRPPAGNAGKISTVPGSRLRPAGGPRQFLLSGMFFPMPCSCTLIPTTRSSRPSSPAGSMPRQRSRRRRTTWVEANSETLRLVSEEPFASLVQAIAVRKGDLDTLNFFNGWIAARNADGWLDQRRRYWFETREWADQVATDS